jgi:quinol monooxygenase YgiN
MYARIVHGSVKPNQMDEFLRMFREEFVPILKETAGFEQMIIVPDRDNDSIVALVMYASKADADADDAGFRQRAAKLSHLLAGPPQASVNEVAILV